MAKSALVIALLVACGTSNPSGGGGGGGGGGGRTDAPGSGSGSNQLDIYQSGTRIKMRVLTTPDGAKQWAGWHDTQLNVDCSFETANDGSTRCMPTGAAGLANYYYSDAACTTPVVLTTCGATPPTYGLLYSVTTSCPAQLQYTAYQITGVASTLYLNSSGTCTAETIPSTETAFTVGAALPSSMFQSATEDVE